MKSRSVLFALLTVLIASTGLVWAASDGVPTTPAAPAGPAPAADDPATTAAELLEDIVPAPDARAGGCCAADCWDYYFMCLDECGPNNQPCRAGCQADKRACLQGC